MPMIHARRPVEPYVDRPGRYLQYLRLWLSRRPEAPTLEATRVYVGKRWGKDLSAERQAQLVADVAGLLRSPKTTRTRRSAEGQPHVG